MYKLAIIGHPISHSLSSVMQNAALKEAGLEGCYEALDTLPEDLVSRVKYLKANGYNGFNVTIPHKVPITLFLEQFDEWANLSGAVNTVKILEDKTLYGYNTDVAGFLEALPKDINLEGKKACVIGTGGASRAVCTALQSLKVDEIILYSRNIINSHEKIMGFRNKFKNTKITLRQIETLESLRDFGILVNTTPVGMKSFMAGVSPVSENLVHTLPDDSIIYDIIYNPIKTELINYAIKHNKKYVTGLDMLVFQGAYAFKIWTGLRADINAMKVAVLENLL